jgi:hypothetical protein
MTHPLIAVGDIPESESLSADLPRVMKDRAYDPLPLDLRDPDVLQARSGEGDSHRSDRRPTRAKPMEPPLGREICEPSDLDQVLVVMLEGLLDEPLHGDVVDGLGERRASALAPRRGT